MIILCVQCNQGRRRLADFNNFAVLRQVDTCVIQVARSTSGVPSFFHPSGENCKKGSQFSPHSTEQRTWVLPAGTYAQKMIWLTSDSTGMEWHPGYIFTLSGRLAQNKETHNPTQTWCNKATTTTTTTIISVNSYSYTVKWSSQRWLNRRREVPRRNALPFHIR